METSEKNDKESLPSTQSRSKQIKIDADSIGLHDSPQPSPTKIKIIHPPTVVDVTTTDKANKLHISTKPNFTRTLSSGKNHLFHHEGQVSQDNISKVHRNRIIRTEMKQSQKSVDDRCIDFIFNLKRQLTRTIAQKSDQMPAENTMISGHWKRVVGSTLMKSGGSSISRAIPRANTKNPLTSPGMLRHIMSTGPEMAQHHTHESLLLSNTQQKHILAQQQNKESYLDYNTSPRRTAPRYTSISPKRPLSIQIAKVQSVAKIRQNILKQAGLLKQSPSKNKQTTSSKNKKKIIGNVNFQDPSKSRQFVFSPATPVSPKTLKSPPSASKAQKSKFNRSSICTSEMSRTGSKINSPLHSKQGLKRKKSRHKHRGKRLSMMARIEVADEQDHSIAPMLNKFNIVKTFMHHDIEETDKRFSHAGPIVDQDIITRAIKSAAMPISRYNFNSAFNAYEMHNDLSSTHSQASRMQESIKSFQTFSQKSNLYFTFQHHSRRWKTFHDIKMLEPMTANKFRKEGVNLAAAIVKDNKVNMNQFVRAHKDTPTNKFKLALKTAYQILDHKPDAPQFEFPNVQDIPLFLPSLSIVFDLTKEQINNQKVHCIHFNRARMRRLLAERKEKEFKNLKKKIKNLTLYKLKLAHWQKTRSKARKSILNTMDKNKNDFDNIYTTQALSSPTFIKRAKIKKLAKKQDCQSQQESAEAVINNTLKLMIKTTNESNSWYKVSEFDLPTRMHVVSQSKLNKSPQTSVKAKIDTTLDISTSVNENLNQNQNQQQAGATVPFTPRAPQDPPPSKKIQQSSFSAARFRRYQKPAFKRTPKAAPTVGGNFSQHSAEREINQCNQKVVSPNLKKQQGTSKLAGATKSKSFFNESLFVNEINKTLEIAQKRGRERNITQYGGALTKQTKARCKRPKIKTKKNYNKLLHAQKRSVMASLQNSSNSVSVRIV